MLPASRHCR
uniref:Uncharacterized protein n=1 Tax=Arundo donax TaxID=35708 RepID=A0A0A8ZFJ3_ARUDO